MKREPIIKIGSYILVICLFGMAIFWYNTTSTEETMAEGSLAIACPNPEIPVGVTIDLATKFVLELFTQMREAESAALSQEALIQEFLTLPDQCVAANCSYSCVLVQYPCEGPPLCDWDIVAGDWACVPQIILCERCDITPCAGEPCPRARINAVFSAIDANHQRVKRAKKIVDALFEDKLDKNSILYKEKGFDPDIWRYCPDQTKKRLQLTGIMKDETTKDLIACLLEESRRGLGNCVTPANFYSAPELAEPELLYSCQEAKFQGLLTDKQREECYVNNFYCCFLYQQ